MNLNVNEWKEFLISDILYSPSVRKFSAIPEEDGDKPFISSTSTDNGIAKYVNEATTPGNCMTVSTNGDCFDCFYQPYPFVASNDIEVLKNDNIGEKQYLFLCSVMNLEKKKWSYGRKPKNSKVLTVKIKLPAKIKKRNENEIIYETTPDGKYIPDWDFMEKYVESLSYKHITTRNKAGHSIDTKKWKEFVIDDLFEVVLSKGDIKLDYVDLGEIKLISSGDTNNGVVGYISKDGDGKAETFNANLMTVDMFGKAYYQPEVFYSVSHGRVNILKPKFELNKYIGLFISTCIEAERYRFSYGRAVYSNVIQNQTVRLPILKDDADYPVLNKTGNYIPDWKYMEDYIKSLPGGDKI